MSLTNHGKWLTRSYRNDDDFAFFGNSSLPGLSTRNAAQFDGEYCATGQLAPAENILSGRAIASVRTGCMHGEQGYGVTSCPLANDSDVTSEPAFCYRATLFDSVMDFLDRHQQMAARLPSCKGAK